MTNPMKLLQFVVALAAVGLFGCGYENPLGRRAISGTVTLDGNPLPRGYISFEPADKETVMRGGAVITDGRYALSVEKGLPPGKYLVRVRAVERAGATDSRLPPGAEPEKMAPFHLIRQPIPPKYNDRSELIREVLGDGLCTLDFDLATK